MGRLYPACVAGLVLLLVLGLVMLVYLWYVRRSHPPGLVRTRLWSLTAAWTLFFLSFEAVFLGLYVYPNLRTALTAARTSLPTLTNSLWWLQLVVRLPMFHGSIPYLLITGSAASIAIAATTRTPRQVKWTAFILGSAAILAFVGIAWMLGMSIRLLQQLRSSI